MDKHGYIKINVLFFISLYELFNLFLFHLIIKCLFWDIVSRITHQAVQTK